MFERVRSKLSESGKEAVAISKRFRLRRTPTGASYAIADSVAMLNPEHWDAVTQASPVFMSRRYLQALSMHLPAGMRAHAALAYQGDTPIAAIAAQSIHVSANSVPKPEGPQRKRDKAVWQALAGVDQRVLICGNLLSWGGHGVAFASNVEPDKAWPAVTEALYRMRKADRLFGRTDFVLIKDLARPDLEAEQALRAYSYKPFETEPDMQLALDPAWRSFDDYLASLRKDYRKAIKNVDKAVRAESIAIERLTPSQVHAERDAIHSLYSSVQQGQRLRLITLAPSYIPALSEAFAADFVTSVLRGKEGKLVGFVTTLRDREGAIGYYIGFDKAVAARGVPIYLRLLHAVIEDALSMGARWVSFGRTALEPKARLGAEPSALQCYVRHRIDPMNVIVRHLMQLMPEPELPPERHPFKE